MKFTPITKEQIDTPDKFLEAFRAIPGDVVTDLVKIFSMDITEAADVLSARLYRAYDQDPPNPNHEEFWESIAKAYRELNGFEKEELRDGLGRAFMILLNPGLKK